MCQLHKEQQCDVFIEYQLDECHAEAKEGNTNKGVIFEIVTGVVNCIAPCLSAMQTTISQDEGHAVNINFSNILYNYIF